MHTPQQDSDNAAHRDDETVAGPRSQRTDKTATGLGGFWGTFALLTVIGVPLSWLGSFIFVMTSDGCLAHNTGWLCTAWGQQIAYALPWTGWVLAIVASLTGVGLRRRHEGAPWAGLLTGGALYILIIGVGFLAIKTALP